MVKQYRTRKKCLVFTAPKQWGNLHATIWILSNPAFAVLAQFIKKTVLWRVTIVGSETPTLTDKVTFSLPSHL
jgi:hypothetical protein